MKAFILAAGFGTRLSPLTDHIPKPLIPVLNIPSLCYTLFLLKRAGIREIICNTHHHADAIKRFVESSDFTDLLVTFSEEREILGTGGGLKKCENLLGDDEFLLVNSDIISDIDVAALIRHHHSSKRAGTLTLYETPEAATIGSVGIENDLVKDFANRRATGLVSSFIYTGMAVFSPAIFRFLKAEFSGIVDTGFTGLIDNGGLGYFRHEGLWMDIGSMESYWKANVHATAIMSTLAGPMNRLTGMQPRLISGDAEISADAEISSSVIGRGCRIGAHAKVSHSVLLPGTVVEPGSRITDAVMDPFNVTTISRPKQNGNSTW